MILERLYLENYKQFREPLELEPPEGAIGVVGTNGSGKTTIFEAILWAFFGPQAGGEKFKTDAIPWSGGAASDRTVVQVTLKAAGQSYTVERTLKSRKAEARVFTGNGPEHSLGEEIVGGPRETAAWVQNELLGMDRTAFESTFFARQKELEFFSGVTGVSRQREVARLLGINQVESARTLLAEDMREAQQEAKLLESRLAAVDIEGLEHELESVKADKAEQAAALELVAEEFYTAERDLKSARTGRERLDESYRRHNRLASQAATARSERDRAADRAATLRGRIGELQNEERLLAGFREELERLPPLLEELERREAARRRVERRAAVEKELSGLRDRSSAAVSTADRRLSELDDWSAEEPVPGWSEVFRVRSEARLERAVAALAGLPEALRVAGEDSHRLREARRVNEEHHEREREAGVLEERIRRGERMESEQTAELGAVTGGRELDREYNAARERREEHAREVSSLRASAGSNRQQAERLSKAAAAVEDAGYSSHCPTCRRGFESENEYRQVIGTLRDQAAEFSGRERENEVGAGSRERAASEEGERMKEIARAQGSASELEKGLQKTRAGIEALQAQLKERRQRLEEERQGLPEPPAVEELTAAEERERRLERLREAAPKLERLAEVHREAVEQASELARERETLADAAYDPREHESLQTERSRLERIRGRVQDAEARTQRLPELDVELATAEEGRRSADARAGELAVQLQELAFDEEEHRAAGERLRSAESRLEEVRERRDAAGREHDRLESWRQGLAAELSGHREERREADEKAASAERLDQMNRLFKEFYGELSGRARPTLQQEAGELIRTLTDNRYERLEFDENYGIRLFDGLSDAYGIERFSGGEADIVSLSARVALSKVVATRNSEALGFIVLDEVFGALDADRRNNVLLALDRLKRVFGQIFIISHVVEVQESALVDELWLVEEDAEGRSSIRVLKNDPQALEEVS